MITLSKIPTDKLEIIVQALERYKIDNRLQLLETVQGSSNYSILLELLPKLQNMVNRTLIKRNHSIKVWYHQAFIMHEAFMYFKENYKAIPYENTVINTYFMELNQKLAA